MESIEIFLSSAVFKVFFAMFQIFIIVLWLSMASWTYRDATRRGSSAAYWATVAVFFLIFGWMVYMILRPPEFIDDVRERALEIKARQIEIRNTLAHCPACKKIVEKDFLICPHCRKKLKNACSKCEKPINLSWTICPFCKTKI